MASVRGFFAWLAEAVLYIAAMGLFILATMVLLWVAIFIGKAIWTLVSWPF